MYDIIIGRDEEDRKKYGEKGIIFIGKHYIKMGQTTSLSSPIYLDVSRSHVIFVCGKRGGGKSYTMGVIAEAISDLPEEVAQNLSVVLVDTMGVYWAMKYPNKKEEDLLKSWEIEPKGLPIVIFTPKGYFNDFKEKGIPTDFPFSVKPSELDAIDWCTTFEIDIKSPMGVLIERIIWIIRKKRKEYSIKDIITEVLADQREEAGIKNAVENRFLSAESWGLFDEKGTPLKELVKGGQITVLDVSCYATIPGSMNIKSLVVGLVAEKLFIERMIARRNEEFESIHKQINFLSEESEETKQEFPLVWLVVDEAHEFLPREGSTLASAPLITILREGRQPGISLILASQQPGKIHTDVLTQADTVIAHRITARLDVEALGMLMQSYMRQGLDKELDNLPRVKGAAIVFDDTNERMYPMRVRPRLSWHGGEAPSAVHIKKKIFEF